MATNAPKASNLVSTLGAELATPVAAEPIDLLLRRDAIRVERIVSRGHASPPGFWYDQDERQLVFLLSGAARLSVDDGQTLALRPGDYLDIAPHQRHRVDWTDPDQDTVWLAIFVVD